MNEDHLHFTGVKLGDVNGDATFDDTESRNQPQVVLHYLDRDVSPGERFEVQFSFEEIIDLTGLQLELRSTTDLTIDNYQSADLPIADQHISFHDGQVYLSWDDITGRSIGKDRPIFTLQVESHTAGRLSDMLALGSGRIMPELYDLSGSVSTLALTGDLQTQKLELSAAPNPFSQVSILQFSIAVESTVLLEVYDQIGRPVIEREMQLTKGSHEILLEESELSGSGVYHCILKSANLQERISILLIE